MPDFYPDPCGRWERGMPPGFQVVLLPTIYRNTCISLVKDLQELGKCSLLFSVAPRRGQHVVFL